MVSHSLILNFAHLNQFCMLALDTGWQLSEENTLEHINGSTAISNHFLIILNILIVH